MMKIGILTSSRADFGILKPLINILFKDKYFEPYLIVFGSHLSKQSGHTINEIIDQGFSVYQKFDTAPEDDSQFAIANSIRKTVKYFTVFWNENQFDLVFVLGDRYEIFAAVAAASPFNVNFAHIHAGETTLGAIDNSYRHSISLLSDIFFVTTEEYKKRTNDIVQKPGNIFNVGALSIDNLSQEKLYSKSEFETVFNIDLGKPTILSTFHPETLAFNKNVRFIRELFDTFDVLKDKYQIIITMPNLDSEGLLLRGEIKKYFHNQNNIYLVESFGMKGYLSCMAHCQMLIGNTSSGFVEASYFPKWVINIGNRQKGRILTPNIINTKIDKDEILNAVNEVETMPPTKFSSIYGDGYAAPKIIKIIKKLYANK